MLQIENMTYPWVHVALAGIVRVGGVDSVVHSWGVGPVRYAGGLLVFVCCQPQAASCQLPAARCLLPSCKTPQLHWQWQFASFNISMCTNETLAVNPNIAMLSLIAVCESLKANPLRTTLCVAVAPSSLGTCAGAGKASVHHLPPKLPLTDSLAQGLNGAFDVNTALC